MSRLQAAHCMLLVPGPCAWQRILYGISPPALAAPSLPPARMKRELFQVSEPVCEIAVYDMVPGSGEKWTWEVRPVWC